MLCETVTTTNKLKGPPCHWQVEIHSDLGCWGKFRTNRILPLERFDQAAIKCILIYSLDGLPRATMVERLVLTELLRGESFDGLNCQLPCGWVGMIWELSLLGEEVVCHPPVIFKSVSKLLLRISNWGCPQKVGFIPLVEFGGETEDHILLSPHLLTV